MQVSVLLQGKGPSVVTIDGAATTSEALAVLAEHGIGAVVVSSDGAAIDGVLSERDVVRALAERGAAILEEPVSTLMTTSVFTCEPDTTVEQLMALMTEHRIRHVPVVVEGRLSGIVSIGDVVKDRISALEHETKALQSYITNPY